MLRLRWRAQIHAVAGARLHQRIGERRAPADIAAVEVHLVDAYDRDDVFEAGGVLVGHGCAEEDARRGCPLPSSGGIGGPRSVGWLLLEAKSPINIGLPAVVVDVVGVFAAG